MSNIPPVLPSVERIEQGKVRILSQRRSGSRGLAILHDCDSGISFVAIVFYERGGERLMRVGHAFSLRHGLAGLEDIVSLVADAKAAPR